MKSLRFILFAMCAIILCGALEATAQTTAQNQAAANQESQTKELKVGDSMPEFTLES